MSPQFCIKHNRTERQRYTGAHMLTLFHTWKHWEICFHNRFIAIESNSPTLPPVITTFCEQSSQKPWKVKGKCCSAYSIFLPSLWRKPLKLTIARAWELGTTDKAQREFYISPVQIFSNVMRAARKRRMKQMPQWRTSPAYHWCRMTNAIVGLSF